MNIYWLSILFAIIFSTVSAQPNSLNAKEKKRIKLLKEFAQYLQKNDLDPKALDHIRNQYLAPSIKPDSVTLSDWSQRQQSIDMLLGETGRSVQNIRLEEYDATPWLKFSQPGSLPKMLWEAPRINNIGGRTLPTANAENDKQIGKQQQANTLVIYKKSALHTPLYYVLFDEESDKIRSWILLKQGEYHYFVAF
jgi:hypothetical protein